MSVKKPVSKRFATRHRAKVDKKVREHRRKLNKGLIGGKSNKSKKDPGVPRNMPDRDAFISTMRAEAEREKLNRREAIAKNDLSRLALQAQQRQETMKTDDVAPALAKVPTVDHSKRAYYREFRQVVQNADVILQVLDARDPLGCRVKAVEDLIQEHNSSKRLVLVLNKIDLVPRAITTQWLAHLRKEYPTIAFRASSQPQKQVGMQESPLSNGECLGADTLLQLLKNYCRSLDIKTSIRVGIIGYPNVGKSSLINALKRGKVCKVGASAGVTTANQEIILDKNIRLIDSPGIVFDQNPQDIEGQSDLFLRNCLKIESIQDPISPISLLLNRISHSQLISLYGIPQFSSTEEFLSHMARRGGKLKKGGIPNLEAAARSVLVDWNQGKIHYFTMPPAPVAPLVNENNSVTVHTSLAPEFDLSSIEQLEVDTVLANVPESTMTDGVEFKSSGINTDRTFCDSLKELEEEDSMTMMMEDEVIPRNIKPKTGYEVSFTKEEMELNPQVNKNKKNQLKAERKKAAKRESYDFKTDYQMN